MKFRAEKIVARDLDPGDLFSSAGPEYWDHAGETTAVGERVFIRTSVAVMSPAIEAEEVYRITVGVWHCEGCGEQPVERNLDGGHTIPGAMPDNCGPLMWVPRA